MTAIKINAYENNLLNRGENHVSSLARGRGELSLQSELLDDRIVAALVRGLQIVQVRPAIGDHLQEAPAGVDVLRVLLKVLRELVDLLAEERDLDIGRAGVEFMPGGTFNSSRLLLRGKHRYP